MRFHSYKNHITYKLKEKDKASWMNFWSQFWKLMDNDEGVWEVLIMSDETHFHLSSYTNRISDTAVITILRRSTRNLSIVKR
jgi:hypothetical protein